MKEKWNTALDNNAEENNQKHFSGQPVVLLYAYDSNHQWNRSGKAPSTQAIINYNNIILTTPNNSPTTSMPNLQFPGSEMSGNGRKSEPVTPFRSPLLQGRNNVLSANVESRFSDTGSEKTNFTVGSNGNLIERNIVKPGWRFHSWPSSFERGLSCVSLAACYGNVSRLPAMVAQHGGAPFLVAYTILIVLVGAPLVFLELGIGQIVQQGVTRTWRAVPMFRGVSYVKLAINMILCIYYPLYIGLALFYLVWLAKGDIPFTECAVVKRYEDGYKTKSIPGEQCLMKTFLESPLNNSMWFGIYAALLCLTWIIIMLCSFRRIKAYIRSVNCFFIPLFLCLIALLVKAVEIQDNSFLESVDWTILQNADVWYYATIQLFFSTHLGFGNVVTCAGKVYNKANPFWAAFAYMSVNIIVGVFSVSICYLLMGESLQQPINSKLITELYLFNTIYDHADLYKDSTFPWTVLAYFIILLSGFISMLAIVFTILKAIRTETKNNWAWWQTSAVFCFVFFTLGTLAILVPNLGVVHVLDHYVVGNLILLCSVLEVGAFVYIYGCSNIYLDFEFILGGALSILWKLLWWLAPIILLAVSVWTLATVRLTGVFKDDPVWMYATGWCIVVFCIVVIIAIAGYVLYIQVDYNFVQKLGSALKPSRKWGPIDPIFRHDWIQWRSNTGTGERDFTLKRRGTRDYTHSVKNRKHTDQKYTSTSSDLATIRALSSPSLNSSEQNGGFKRHTLEVVSITDTLERPDKSRLTATPYYNHYNSSHSILNPLGVPSMYGDTTTNDSNSEGYGTIRNGPYVVANEEFDHVCWRKTHEQATEL